MYVFKKVGGVGLLVVELKSTKIRSMFFKRLIQSSSISRIDVYGTTKTGCRTTSVGCRDGSRYVEGYRDRPEAAPPLGRWMFLGGLKDSKV